MKNRCKSRDSFREGDKSYLGQGERLPREDKSEGNVLKVLTHGNCHCQRKEELLMKDRRSCGAAELWQGIPSVVIAVAGTMVHQNREPQGVVYNAGVSKATEINTQSVPVGTRWWTGPLKVIQSTGTAPKAPETQLGKVHLLPRAQELTQHKAGNHRDQICRLCCILSPFPRGTTSAHTIRGAWVVGRGRTAAAASGKAAGAIPQLRQQSISTIQKTPFFILISYLSADLRGFFSVWQSQLSSPEAEALR